MSLPPFVKQLADRVVGQGWFGVNIKGDKA